MLFLLIQCKIMTQFMLIIINQLGLFNEILLIHSNTWDKRHSLEESVKYSRERTLFWLILKGFHLRFIFSLIRNGVEIILHLYAQNYYSLEQYYIYT
jgi:ABC-type iron transport system FetAB permease component